MLAKPSIPPPSRDLVHPAGGGRALGERVPSRRPHPQLSVQDLRGGDGDRERESREGVWQGTERGNGERNQRVCCQHQGRW